MDEWSLVYVMKTGVYPHLHEPRDGLDGLIRLVERLSPRVGCPMRTCVFWSLGQEAGHILNTPVCPAQLGIKEASASVVLEESLFRKNDIQLIVTYKNIASGTIN